MMSVRLRISSYSYEDASLTNLADDGCREGVVGCVPSGVAAGSTGALSRLCLAEFSIMSHSLLQIRRIELTKDGDVPSDALRGV